LTLLMIELSPTETSPPALHDALPIWPGLQHAEGQRDDRVFRSRRKALAQELAAHHDRARLPSHVAHHGAEPQLAAVRDDRIRQRSEEHTAELQSPDHLVFRLLLEIKK